MAVFNGERPDVYPCFEHFWGEAIERWKGEGLPEGVDLVEYFGLDISGCGGFDLTARYPEEIISEDDTYTIKRDSRGVVAQHHKMESGHTPRWLDTPIKTPDDWWSYKERLVYDPSRVDMNQIERAKLLREQGKFVALFNADPYEQAWPVFGQVQIFMSMIERPDVVKDSLDTWADLTVKCIDEYTRAGLEYDAYFIYGDMGYRNGTLFGSDVYKELVMPAHRKIVNFLHDNCKQVLLHSCGKIKSFLPMLIDVGFDAIQPLEAKCDQDVRELVKEYGRKIVFFGNIDVRTLSSTKEAIREEIESKLAAFDGSWNYIFHSDHSVPQTVSLENYQYALDVVKGYLKQR